MLGYQNEQVDIFNIIEIDIEFFQWDFSEIGLLFIFVFFSVSNGNGISKVV